MKWLLMFITLCEVNFRAYGELNLVWSDEFNGTSLNTNTWSLANCGPTYWGSGQIMWYTNDTSHASVSNGFLAIKATAALEGTNVYLASARMISIGFDQCSANLFPESNPLSFYLGALEVRARIPVGTGLWPAVWMIPVPVTSGDNNWPGIEGYWPGSGEIDLIETAGGNGEFASNVIDQTGNHYIVNLVNDVTQWHLYRLNWMTNALQVVVDGVTNGTITSWTPPTGHACPAPFDTPFCLTMNVALGGFYTGNPSPAQCAASLPAEMDIDYVRVYEETEPLAISFTQTNGDIVLNWPANIVCHLQTQYSLVNGVGGDSNWVDVIGATTPYVLATTNVRSFYRLASP
jgi:beta-glucanase (GH16 family)